MLFSYLTKYYIPTYNVFIHFDFLYPDIFHTSRTLLLQLLV